MIEMGNLRLVVLSALAVAMLSGCGAGVSDRKAYDDLYANPPAQAKYTFDVPYKEASIKSLTCDTGSMAEALKAVYGNDIRFERAPAAYTVNLEKLTFGKHATSGNHYMARIDAHAAVKIDGRIHKVTGEYGFQSDISESISDSRSICDGVMLDIARKIKYIIDNHAEPEHDIKGRENKLHIY